MSTATAIPFTHRINYTRDVEVIRFAHAITITPHRHRQHIKPNLHYIVYYRSILTKPPLHIPYCSHD